MIHKNRVALTPIKQQGDKKMTNMTQNPSTAFKTDFYEFTMTQAAIKSGMATKKAVFELFARKLPTGRRYGVVSGIGRAIQAVMDFRFTPEQIRFLKADGRLDADTIEFLKNYKFEGKIFGYNDGDLYFPNSPILTVEGTFADSVILETVLLSILNHDSAVASAASRMVVAGKGMPIIEMGSRRTHEDAAIATALSAYITGFASTSNVEAAMRYGVPFAGTSAHAFSLAFPTEVEAFEAQVSALGTGTTLLVDTYDIEQGIRNAVQVAGTELGGIRIDSGDLHEETVNARKLLDELGAKNAKITLSSDIDEFTIAELMDRGTPVDGVGAGTRVATGSGHPTAGMVFKLVAIENEDGTMRPVAKKASGKASVGGRKWAYREFDDAGKIVREFFTLAPLKYEDIEGKNIKAVQMLHVWDYSHHAFDVEAARENHVKAIAMLPEEALQMTAGEAAFVAELAE